MQYNSLQIAKYLHKEIGAMKPFVPYSDEVPNPIFVWRMDDDYQKSAKWTLYDLQDKLAQKGWMVPAYTMPANIEKMVVMRVLCKQGFSRDMADQLLDDIRFAVDSLEKLEYPTTSRIAMEKNVPLAAGSFNHTGK